MDILMIILRTLLLYGIVLFIFRVMGKREIGELSILDLVVFIMIAEMAVVAIESPDASLVDSLTPMFILMGLQILFSLLSMKSKRFRDFVDGKPTIIINKGKVDEQAMRSQRYNFDDLLLQLREKDVRNIADVEFAVLEPSGKLSVFPYDDDKQIGSFTLPIVLDGKVMKENLESLELTEQWLMANLQKRGYITPDKISFCSYQNGKFYIDEMDEKKKS